MTDFQKGHVPQKERPSYLTVVLWLMPLISTVLLALSLPSLLDTGDSIWGYAKLVIIPIGAYVVTYATFRLAIERAAPLAVVGVRYAAALGLASILIVGSASSLGTYPGFVKNDVIALELEQYASDQETYIETQYGDATAASKVVPIISTISADSESKKDCEQSTSCVSGKGRGGYGQIARLMESIADRSRAVGAEAAAGLAVRDAAMAELSGLTAKMRDVLADQDVHIKDRRKAMQAIDGEIAQALARLREAVPVDMIAGYADELRTGVVVRGDAAVTDRVNGFLIGYASAIDSVLASIEPSDVTPPVFPARVGALDTLAYVGTFAPVAIIVAGLDLLFPVGIFLYALMGLRAADGIARAHETPTPRAKSLFEEMIERPIEIPRLKAPQQIEDKRPRRTNKRRTTPANRNKGAN